MKYNVTVILGWHDSTMDYPDFVECNFMENCIGTISVNIMVIMNACVLFSFFIQPFGQEVMILPLKVPGYGVILMKKQCRTRTGEALNQTTWGNE